MRVWNHCDSTPTLDGEGVYRIYTVEAGRINRIRSTRGAGRKRWEVYRTVRDPIEIVIYTISADKRMKTSLLTPNAFFS